LIVCFVHNLSYDIEFLLPYLRVVFGKEKNTIVLSSHKVLSVKFECIEFRCSYLLTQKSLDVLSKEYNIKNKKLTGTIDYTKVRYQDDILDNNVLDYFVNDIVGLHQIIKILIGEKRGIKNLPYTITGYVRQYCRGEARKQESNRRNFINTQLDFNMYQRIRTAFKGGYTHTNIDYRSVKVTDNIEHYDFESHYPTVMLLEKYPLGKFKENKVNKRKDLDFFDKTHCQIIHILIHSCKLKPNKHFTYISVVDCNVKCKNDNGRVYECSEDFDLYITYEDLLIIEQQYFISYEILNTWISIKKPLPNFMRTSILSFFTKKNNLKVEIHNCKDDSKLFDLNRDYMRVKGMLNGLYGMCATDPIRDEFTIQEDLSYFKLDNPIENKKEKLQKYYKSRNSFLPYQWGIWVTAYARKYLFDVFETIGQENVLYCDTDSAFFKSNDKIIANIKEYNNNLRQKAIETNSYIETDKGKKYIGGFYDEEEKIKIFKALHSKCYMYKDEKGLHTTIAGVVKAYKDKNNNVHFNTEELDSFDKFDDGFKFSKRFGGTISKHILGRIRKENINGHMTDIASGIIIESTEKELHNNYDELR